EGRGGCATPCVDSGLRDVLPKGFDKGIDATSRAFLPRAGLNKPRECDMTLCRANGVAQFSSYGGHRPRRTLASQLTKGNKLWGLGLIVASIVIHVLCAMK